MISPLSVYPTQLIYGQLLPANNRALWTATSQCGVCYDSLGYCLSGMPFTPSLAWESFNLSTLLPVTRPSTRTSQPSSRPIHPHHPSLFTLPVVPPPYPRRLPAPSRLPYLCLLSLLTPSPSHPCHFHPGRPTLPRVMTLSPRGHRRGSHQVCRFPAG